MSTTKIVFILLLFSIDISKGENDLESQWDIEKLCAKRVLLEEVQSYGKCILNLSNDHKNITAPISDWPLTIRSDCSARLQDGVNAVCSPRHVEIESLTLSYVVNVTNKLSPKFFEYFIVKWLPCRVGIADVTGYKITLRKEFGHSASYCLEVNLTRVLTLDDIYFAFSAPLLTEIDFSQGYVLEMVGLPLTETQIYTPIKFRSKSCIELNPTNPCVCLFWEISTLPAPTITVNNYTIAIRSHMLSNCWNFSSIKFLLKIISKHVYINNKELQKGDINGKSDLSVSFNNIFPVPRDAEFEISYIVTGYSKSNNVLHKFSKKLIINSPIQDNPARIDSIVVQDYTVTACILCVALVEPDSEPILYSLKLSLVGSNEQNLQEYLKNEQIQNVSCISGVVRPKFFVSVRGLYSLQIKEVRPLHPFVQQPWSAVDDKTMFSVELSNKYPLVLAIVIPLGVLLFIGIILFFCVVLLINYRRYEPHLQRRLPQKLTPFLEKHADMMSREHNEVCVWIVWQVNYKSSEQQKIHAENVRLFASYLSIHCGLRVELDQFNYATSSYTAWVTETSKKAEVVLFILPYEEVETKDKVLEYNGNFGIVYRYFEMELYATSKNSNCPRFATIKFPYSSLNSCEMASCLIKTTKVFKLMDEIEDLYFFIQNQSKYNVFGKIFVRGVNKKEFALTPEGKSLNRGIDNMMNFIHLQNSLPHKIRPTQETAFGVNFSPPAQIDSLLKNSIKPPHESFEEFSVKYSAISSTVPPPNIYELDSEEAETSFLLINSKQN